MSGHNRKKIRSLGDNIPIPNSGSKKSGGFINLLSGLVGRIGDKTSSLPDLGKSIDQAVDNYRTGAGGTQDFRDYGKDLDTETQPMSVFLDMLNNGGNLNDLIAYYLMNLSKQEGFTDEIRDQMRTLLMQMGLTADQRAYDRKVLEDSRLYSNPQNELARLMGAGISRDAALQMMSGSAGNLGGSSGASPSAPGVIQTTGTQDLNRKQFALNAITQGVSMLGQLVDSGLSLAQGVETVKGMQMQNSMNETQLAAYNSTNQLVQQVELLKKSGALESADIEQLSNADDFIKYMQGLAQNNQDIASLLDSDAYKGTFGSLAGRDFFNQYWSNVRKSRDDGSIADEFIKSQRLDNARRGLENANLGAELVNINADTIFKRAETEEVFARICLTNAQTANTDAQTEFLGIQGEYTQQLTKLTEAQEQGQRWTNEQLRMDYELNKQGFPMLKQVYVDELEDKLLQWTCIKNLDIRKNQIQSWMQEERNRNHAAYIEAIRLNAVGDFQTTCPGWYRLGVILKNCGASEYVKDIVNVGSSVVPAAKGAKYLNLIK